jgi:hypothetical protein
MESILTGPAELLVFINGLFNMPSVAQKIQGKIVQLKTIKRKGHQKKVQSIIWDIVMECSLDRPRDITELLINIAVIRREI